MNYQRLIMAVFFLQPIAFGSWLPRIPDIKAYLRLSDGELALALLGMPVGILLTLPFAGRFVEKVGARAILVFGFPLYLALVALPPFSQNIFALFLTLGLVGIGVSTLELALNVKADQIEKHQGVGIMSVCHGFWALGIMAGNIFGSILAQTGLAPHWSVIIVCLVSLPICVLGSAALPRLAAAAPPPPPEARPRLGLPGLTLLGICFFTFGVTMTEGAVADWSAVFLRSIFGAEPALAGAGYTVFALLLAGGRFVGEPLKARYGAVLLARACGTLSIIGVALVALSPNLIVSFVGFGAIGIGASVAFPLAVTASAALTDRPAASSVAILSFIALIGFLIGPPLIGFVSEYADLRWGLAMLLPMLVISLLLTGTLGAQGKAKPVIAPIEA